MTEKDILLLQRKVNKARIEISTILENLQSSINKLEPEDDPKNEDEPPF